MGNNKEAFWSVDGIFINTKWFRCFVGVFELVPNIYVDNLLSFEVENGFKRIKTQCIGHARASIVAPPMQHQRREEKTWCLHDPHECTTFLCESCGGAGSAESALSRAKHESWSILTTRAYVWDFNYLSHFCVLVALISLASFQL